MFLKAFTKRYFYGKACRILYTLRLFIQCFHMIGNCATDACHRLSYITSYWESLSFHLTILFQHHFIIFLVYSKKRTLQFKLESYSQLSYLITFLWTTVLSIVHCLITEIHINETDLRKISVWNLYFLLHQVWVSSTRQDKLWQ